MITKHQSQTSGPLIGVVFAIVLSLASTRTAFAQASPAAPPPASATTNPGGGNATIQSTGAGGANTPTPTPTSTSSLLGNASIDVGANLDLVNTNIWSGGIKMGPLVPDVIFSSTLPANKPATGTSNEYQDAEVLLPAGATLNAFFSWASVNNNSQTYWDKAANNVGNNPSGTVANGTVGRNAWGNRLYFNVPWLNDYDKTPNSNTSLLADQYIAGSSGLQIYFLNGLGAKVIDREEGSASSSSSTGTGGSGGSGTGSSTSFSPSTSSSNYGFGGTLFLGFGFDGAFIPQTTSTAQPGGNYRLEAFAEGTIVDHGTMETFYPSTKGLKDGTLGGGFNLSVVITNLISVNVQAVAPAGKAKHYMGNTILFGMTIQRP